MNAYQHQELLAAGKKSTDPVEVEKRCVKLREKIRELGGFAGDGRPGGEEGIRSESYLKFLLADLKWEKKRTPRRHRGPSPSKRAGS